MAANLSVDPAKQAPPKRVFIHIDLATLHRRECGKVLRSRNDFFFDDVGVLVNRHITLKIWHVVLPQMTACHLWVNLIYGSSLAGGSLL